MTYLQRRLNRRESFFFFLYGLINSNDLLFEERFDVDREISFDARDSTDNRSIVFEKSVVIIFNGTIGPGNVF